MPSERKNERKNEREKHGCRLCRCETCCKEIPESSSMTSEGMDYVRHFCSIECYEKWWSENKTTNEGKNV